MTACIGALVVTLADLLAKPTNAMSTRIRELLSAEFGFSIEASWPIILVALLLAVAATFVNQPTARADGFARGLAVFALLSLPGSPVENHAAAGSAASGHSRQGLALHDFLGIRPAHAQFGGSVAGGGKSPADQAERVPGAAPDQGLRSPKYGTAPSIVRFDIAGDRRDNIPATVVLQNLKNGKKTRMSWNLKEPLAVVAPAGRYRIEVVASGFRRTRAEIRVDKTARVYDVKVTSSRFPLGIQQLYAPKRVKPELERDSGKIDRLLRQIYRK